MRDGLAVSLVAHAALLTWGLFSLPAPEPLDASGIEAIPVNFIQIEDVTSVPKGVAVAKITEEPPPKPVEKIIDEAPPLPEPEPLPPPEPQPVPPLPPEPEPLPPEPEPPPPVEPTPPEPAPEPPPPEPTPEPPPPEQPPPEAPPEPQPEAPPPEPEPPAPAEAKAEIQPRPENVPIPKPRPRVQKPTPQVAKKEEEKKFDPDQIAALLDKDTAPPAQPEKSEPALGANSSAVDARLSANELDGLRARLAQCWSPPIGWTDPNEVRVVLILNLNPDGTVAGDPQVVERPDGRYAQTAGESALRAVRRCAPYTLPAEKYEAWREVKVTFDPREMGGG